MLRVTFSLTFFLCWFFASSQNPARSGKDHAVFFYVTDFQPGWEALPSTVNDAQAIGEELANNFGFTVEYVPNPTKVDIEDKILDLNKLKYDDKDQLLLYFSMHGHFIENADRGYLIPSDGKTPPQDPFGRSWLSYDDLGTYLSQNPCKHILLSLDACYSGAFGDRWMSYPGNVQTSTLTECKTKEEAALFNTSRLYFTSGSREVRVPAQSKFANRWLMALQDGKQKKVTTTNELRYYFGTIENPKPEGGSFSKDHKGGDFVFAHISACLEAYPSLIINNDIGETTSSIGDEKSAWLKTRKEDTAEAYRKFISEFPNSEFQPLASKRIQEVEAIPGEQTAWNNAKELNSTEGYDDFMRKYPNSIFTDLAEFNKSKLGYGPLRTVFVEGGTFSMTCNNEQDKDIVRLTTISDFHIGVFEITYEEFDAFCDATSKPKPNDNGWGRGKRPVTNVSWEEAIAFCNWRSEFEGLQKVYKIELNNIIPDWNANGYRLPTEAEWEFAARNRGSEDIWSGTSDLEKVHLFVNGVETRDDFYNTAPVGSFEANDLGLFDMSGNVWEWCWDWYSKYLRDAITNPRGYLVGTVKTYRGGGWKDNIDDLQCSSRNFHKMSYKSNSIGFRIARSKK